MSFEPPSSPIDFDTTITTSEDLLEKQVEDLYQLYIEKMRFIENYTETNDEAKESCREVAQQSLFTEIQKLSDPLRASEIVERLFENQTISTTHQLTQPRMPINIEEISYAEEKTEDSNRTESSTHSLSSSETLPQNLGGEAEEDDRTMSPEIITHDHIEQIPQPIQTYQHPEYELLQLFDINENGETIFNRDVLELLCRQIGERPVAIISTAGKFRQGKTFWNNILLKGLQNERADFAADQYIGGQGGIRFQSGYDRHTKGIMVWPQVFARKDKDGNDLAVILMDTQGTFDTCTDIGDSAVIFAISLLMSSIKIFNTKNQIDAQDLDALNVFISFSQKSDEKAGQHFILMMRDALESGLQPEYIEQLKRQARKAPELLRLLNGVFDAFERVECYMVPRPSVHVLKANGEIRAGDCGDDFLAELCGCANHVLDNLVAKTVMGTALTGTTLRQYVENLVEHIRDNHHKAIGSAFAATSQLYFEMARNAANEVFANLHEKLVRTHNHRPIKPQHYEEELHKMIEEALNNYSLHPLFGSPELKAKEYELFKRSLQERCHEKAENNSARFRDVQMADAVNGAYEIYEKEMKPDIVESLLSNSEKRIDFVHERHELAFPKAIDHFENIVTDFLDEEDLVSYKRNLLNEMIRARFEDLQTDNAIMVVQARVREMFNLLLDEYRNTLREQVEKIRKLDEVENVIELCQNLQRGKYSLKKTEFMSEISATLPKIDPEIMGEMLDNYKDTMSVEFKKCEDEFEVQARAHLNMEKIKYKMAEIRHKNQEAHRKLNEEKKKTNERIKSMNAKLEQEQKAREAAESQQSSGIQPLMLMMKEMNESAQRQFEMLRIDREDREKRERAAAEERAHQRQMEMQMLREERESRERREENRIKFERQMREEEQIRQVATEKLRQAEERRRMEAEAAARNKQPPPCILM